MQRSHSRPLVYIVEQRLKYNLKSFIQISVIVVVIGMDDTVFHTLDTCFYSSRNKAEIMDPNYSIPFEVAALTGCTLSPAELPLLEMVLELLLKLLSEPEAHFFDYLQ